MQKLFDSFVYSRFELVHVTLTQYQERARQLCQVLKKLKMELFAKIGRRLCVQLRQFDEMFYVEDSWKQELNWLTNLNWDEESYCPSSGGKSKFHEAKEIFKEVRRARSKLNRITIFPRVRRKRSKTKRKFDTVVPCSLVVTTPKIDVIVWRNRLAGFQLRQIN